MKHLRWKLFLLGLFALCASARAQEVDLQGNVSWEQIGSRIRIHADRVDNNRAEGISGPLRLQIWATEEPYDPNFDIVGYPIATYYLPRLRAGFSLENRTRTVGYRRPPAGFYYTTITLEERDPVTRQYVIYDSENFSGVVNLGGFGEGSVHFDTTIGDVSFLGDISWRSGDGRVKIDVENIVNDRPSPTGALRVRLWATDYPFEGGTNALVGYPMATLRLRRLLPHSNAMISAQTSFLPPPQGEYYVVMTLEEYDRGWYIRDFFTFPGLSLF